MRTWIQGAAILVHRASDVNQIIYITRILLEKAQLREASYIIVIVA